MGVRLYPRTRNPESLERLAGAASGTHLRLELLRQEYGVDDPNRDFWSMQDAYEAFQTAVHADPDLARLDVVASRYHSRRGTAGPVTGGAIRAWPRATPGC